jgi:hypothetical protein
MSTDIGVKLARYQMSLQPRSEQIMQRDQAAAEEADVVYSLAKTTECELSTAYVQNQEAHVKSHAARMARSAQDKPPRYLEAAQPGRKPQRRGR